MARDRMYLFTSDWGARQMARHDSQLARDESASAWLGLEAAIHKMLLVGSAKTFRGNRAVCRSIGRSRPIFMAPK
jgi:hypothetical protein